MLIMAEPYYRSLEMAARVNVLATELGIPSIYVVANKVRTPTEARAIEAFCEKRHLEIITTIPYDEKIAEASLIPKAPLDIYPEARSIATITELKGKLEAVILSTN